MFIPMVGLELCAYCDGYFDIEEYETKRVEAIGIDWVVARTEGGMCSIAKFDSQEEMLSCLKRWSLHEYYEEKTNEG